MKIVLRAEVRARMGLAIALVISAGAGVWAGFNNGKDTDARNYRGSALTDDEKKAVECAIKEIKAMAGNDHSEKNRETLKRIADCLADMLKDGKICSESGTNDAKAATLPESPRKCTWTGDKINVRPKCMKKTEPDFSKLIAVLVHEGIHCLQWQTPTSDGRETVAYAWEAYILCRRLAEATLTDAQKEDIGKRKAFTKWQSDVRGDDSLTEEEKKKKLAECRDQKASKVEPGKQYQQKTGDSSKIERSDENAAVQQTIQTPFARTFDFDVAADGVTGGDLLIVSGDFGGSGGVVYYFDQDGDGFADEPTMTFIGTLPAPISLDYVEPQDVGLCPMLYVLDLQQRSVFAAQACLGGRPDPLNPFPFATPAMLPELERMVAVRGGALSFSGGRSCMVSMDDDQVDDVAIDSGDFELVDQSGDLIADFPLPLTRFVNAQGYVPTIIGDVQDGDALIMAAGMHGRPLNVHLTDANATFLGPILGTGFSPQPFETTPIPVGVLSAGQFIIVVDGLTGERETAGTPVAPPRPEIRETDRAAYLPGEIIMVTGRNFTPSAVGLLSGEPLPTIFIDSTMLHCIAPVVNNLPTNFFELEIDVDGVRSTIAGVEIAPVPPDDCITALGPIIPPSTLSGSTLLAGSDVAPTCGTSVTAPGLWYRVAGRGTTMRVSLCDPGTTYDAKLNIYCGSCDAPVCITGNDDTCGLQPLVTWCAERDVVYYILVQGFNGAVGDFVMHVDDLGTPCGGSGACPPAFITGACCYADGESCAVTTADACASIDGVYQGDGAACLALVGGQEFVYTGGPVAIPDAGGGVAAASIFVADPGVIEPGALQVGLVIQHTFQGDLAATLTSPSGTTVALIDRPGVPESTFGFGADDFGNSATMQRFVLADDAPLRYAPPDVLSPGIARVAGKWRPDSGAMSAFDGEPLAGPWTLTVQDLATSDVGVLLDWALILKGDLQSICSPGCPGARGDANCDGTVDFFDIDPFLLALFNPAGYAATFCGGSMCAVDIDCSGLVDFFDIDPFLTCLFSGCAPCP